MPGLVSATITFDGLPVYLPEVLEAECIAANEPTDWVGKANSWRVVRGAEPSRGWLLMTGLQLDALDLNATDHYLTFKTTGELGVTSKWEQLVIVRADAILPGPTPSPETMYLVEIADRRIYGKLTRSRGASVANRGYNLRTLPCFLQEAATINDYIDNSRKPGSPDTAWTWAQMLENFWSGFNLNTFFGTWADVDIDDAVWPASVPENMATDETIGWEVFNQILDHIGHAIVPKQNGKWRIIQVGVEDTGLSNQLQLLADNGLLLGIKHSRLNSNSMMPRYLMVNFPYSSGSLAGTTPDSVKPAASQHSWINNPTFRVACFSETILGSDNAVSTDDQTYVTLYDSMTALYDRTLAMTASNVGDKATNTTLLNARAIEIAEAWLRKNYNQFHPSYTHNTYSGCVSSIPGSLVSGLCFYDTGDGLKTDFVFHPYSMDMESSRPRVAAYDAIRLNPLDNPGPPDIGRPHPLPDIIMPVEISNLGTGLAGWSKDEYDTMTTEGPALAYAGWDSVGGIIEGFVGINKINELHDALNLHHVSNQSALGIFLQDVNKWVAFGGNQVHLGVVSQGWRAASEGYKISVTPCTADDVLTVDSEIDVWLGECRGRAPNVVTGDFVVFARTSTVSTGVDDLRFVCLTDVNDDPVGTVKFMAISGSVPAGWAVMDGTANAAGNGGSGLDMTGQVITSDGSTTVSDATDYDPGNWSGTAGGDTYDPATLPLYNLVHIERLDNSEP